jgi:hypothetical protein
MPTPSLPGLLASLVPLPNMGPATDTARAAIMGAANALTPTSPETEARFAKLMAGWGAIELRVNSLPLDGGIPGSREVLTAYKKWQSFRDSWLQGQKDGSLLPTQEGALERASHLLDKAAAPVVPAITMPPLPRVERPHRSASPGLLWAAGAVAMVGVTAAAAYALSK